MWINCQDDFSIAEVIAGLDHDVGLSNNLSDCHIRAVDGILEVTGIYSNRVQVTVIKSNDQVPLSSNDGSYPDNKQLKMEDGAIIDVRCNGDVIGVASFRKKDDFYVIGSADGFTSADLQDIYNTIKGQEQYSYLDFDFPVTGLSTDLSYEDACEMSGLTLAVPEGDHTYTASNGYICVTAYDEISNQTVEYRKTDELFTPYAYAVETYVDIKYEGQTYTAVMIDNECFGVILNTDDFCYRVVVFEPADPGELCAKLAEIIRLNENA